MEPEIKNKKRTRTMRIMKENGEEELILDIRQKIMWDNYVNPQSSTFANAHRSAVKAGFAATYARTITSRRFFVNRLRRLSMLPKAEKALDETLDMETVDHNGKQQADLLRIKTDVAKHVTKTLGKDEGWSERTEITGKDGNQIVFLPPQLIAKYNLSSDNTNNE